MKSAKFVKVTKKLHVVEELPADDKFIECAKSANADYIISGDKPLLKVACYKKTQIVSVTCIYSNHNQKINPTRSRGYFQDLYMSGSFQPSFLLLRIISLISGTVNANSICPQLSISSNSQNNPSGLKRMSANSMELDKFKKIISSHGREFQNL